MRYLLLLLSVFSVNSFAKISIAKCIGTEGDVGKTMLLTMKEDLNIDKSEIIISKTEAEIMSQSPVTLALAKTYGLQEKKLSGKGGDDPTTADEYAKAFMLDNAKNMIIRYTYESKNNMHNILLTSAFISDSECIVRFNGYLIIKREF